KLTAPVLSHRTSASSALRTSFTSLYSCAGPPTTQIYPLSLHDALPISEIAGRCASTPEEVERVLTEVIQRFDPIGVGARTISERSEEHTSELQSRFELVCRLRLEKKNYRARSSPRSPSRAAPRSGGRAPAPNGGTGSRTSAPAARPRGAPPVRASAASPAPRPPSA